MTQKISTRTRSLAAAALLAAMGACGAANAATVTAQFTDVYDRSANITMPAWTSGPTGNVTTCTLRWTRLDSPGVGVDTTIAPAFDTYCIEINQFVQVGVSNTYNAMTPAAAGMSVQRAELLGRLWGQYKPAVASADTSAAFQLAVWEIVFDTDNSLSTGTFITNSPSNVKVLSQSWLDSIAGVGYAGPVAQIIVLRSDSAQDQITGTVIPLPNTAALGAVGLSVVGMWRRRVKGR